VVLSKGREVVGLGYSRLLGDATRVPDKGGESAKSNWVDRVCREYDTDRRTDQVTQDSRGNRDGGLGQQANRDTRVTQGNWDGNPKLGNSSRVTENSVTMKSRGTERSANTESQVMEKTTNT
jgi:hypothetical protein